MIVLYSESAQVLAKIQSRISVQFKISQLTKLHYSG